MRTQLLPLAKLAPSEESSLKRHTVAAGCEWRQTPSLTGLTARLAQAKGSLSRAGSRVPDGAPLCMVLPRGNGDGVTEHVTSE